MSASASWFHLSVKTIGRSAGRSVVAAAAYRLGEKLHDREADRLHDYSRRHGVHSGFTIAPDAAPAWVLEPGRLWNAANDAEKRKNSTLAREVELALPAAVPADRRAQIVRDFTRALVDRYGVAASVAIHAPSQRGDQKNHHAHILFTTRAIDADGIGKKTRVLDDRKTGAQEVLWLRAHAADLINAALADSGTDERVDHRSYAERGIDKEATQHLGPSATNMERDGAASEIGDANRATIAQNQTRDALRDERAALDAELAQADPSPNPPARALPTPADLPDRAPDRVPAQTPATRTVLPARSPAEKHPPPLDALFNAVHKRAVERAMLRYVVQHGDAVAEQIVTAIDRVQASLAHMAEVLSGWRDEIAERAAHLLPAWEREEMEDQGQWTPPDRAPSPPPEKGLNR